MLRTRLYQTLKSSGIRPVVAVAAGGLVGSAARAAIGLMIPASDGEFPASVVLINLLGSFLLGLYVVRRERSVSGPASTQFWAIGVLGSFTTFSTFSVDLVQLLADGRVLASVSYAGLSMLGGLVFALLGQRIGTVVR